MNARAVQASHQAMEVLRAESITAMLVDAKLNAADPIQPPTKLLRLLMTVPQEDVPQHKLVEMGFACSIVKPVRPGLLVQAIAALLSTTTLPAKASAVEASKPRAKGGRILLAEDNQINQIVATDLLSNAGYTINVVGDGQSAVQALRDGHYNLVLMDCQMPVMDGLDATRAIRQAEQKIIAAMAKLAESRDPETGAHLDRVRSYSRLLAQQLGGREKFKREITHVPTAQG